MKRRWRDVFLFVFAGLVLSVTGVATPPESADESKSTEGDFIVHEWGTFTTFSGSDGVFVDFRPLAQEHNDLPPYVLDRGSLSTDISRLLTKSRLWGRVRMETPVTYFYTDRVRTVDVKVSFPKGLLTEFYPPVSELQPAIDNANIFGKGESLGDSSLSWNRLTILPQSALAANVTDAKLRDQLADGIAKAIVPHAVNEQHYAAARSTDSAIVHTFDAEKNQSSFEKFLFYRGVGRFDLPIKSVFQDDQLTVSNSGPLPIHSAILIKTEGQRVQASKPSRIEAGAQTSFSELHNVTDDELALMVQESLTAEGLYQKEAEAMIATWKQSWFKEQGTRLMYIVPTSLTDQVLPLSVTPAPSQTVRVLVGRMEIMSPSAEAQMIRAVAISASAREQYLATSAKLRATKMFAIPPQVLGFGRMTEPALIRISKVAKEEPIRREAELLIAQLQASIQ